MSDYLDEVTGEFFPDPGQQKFIDQPAEQPIVLLGAAGTGKSRALIELIAKRVLSGEVSANQILLLAANRRSAAKLRDQIAARLNIAIPGSLSRTMSSLAFELLQNFAHFSGTPAPALMTGAKQEAIIKELLSGTETEEALIWPEPIGAETVQLASFQAQLREFLSYCVENRLSPKQIRDYGANYSRPEWLTAADFLERYNRILAKDYAELKDSAALIQQSAQLLANPQLDSRELGPLAELTTLLVDDAQELSLAQIEFLAAFQSRGTQLILAGDPDTAVGSYRGANPAVLGGFQGFFKVPATEIVLENSYRATGVLAELAAELSTRIGTAQAGNQRQAYWNAITARTAAAAASKAGSGVGVDSGSKAGSVVEAESNSGLAGLEASELFVYQAESYQDEIRFIAKQLRKNRLLDSVPWREQVVVVRSRAQIQQLLKALSSLEVPVRANVAQETLADDPIVHSILQLALFLVDPQAQASEALAEELLTGALIGLDRIQLRKLRRGLLQFERAAGGSRSVAELLAELLTGAELPKAIAANKIGRQVALLQQLLSLDSTELKPYELLWKIWTESAVADRLLEQLNSSSEIAFTASNSLDAAVGLFIAAERFESQNPGASALQFISEQLNSTVAEDFLMKKLEQDSVLIATPADLIGLQFDRVVVAQLQDGMWPNLRIRGGLLRLSQLQQLIDHAEVSAKLSKSLARQNLFHDELRLLLKAVTAAKSQLLVTAQLAEDAVPSQFFDFISRLANSEADSDISGLAVDDETAAVTRALAAEAELTEEAGVKPEADSEGQELKEPVDTNRLSPESLENLSFRNLVAILRKQLVQNPDDEESATALKFLAQRGISGADPSEWYGLAELSTTKPLFEVLQEQAEQDLGQAVQDSAQATQGSESQAEDSLLADQDVEDQASDQIELTSRPKITISPSQLDNYWSCPLHWAISRLAGSRPSVEPHIGTLLHRAMESAERSQKFDFETLMAEIDQYWPGLEFEAPWLEKKYYAETKVMAARVADYLSKFAATGGKVLHQEVNFNFEVDNAMVTGVIDRVEQSESNDLTVVDLKTGRLESTTSAKVSEHTQLSAYQLAVLLGSVDGVNPEKLIGAKLVVVNPKAATKATAEPFQELLSQERREELLELIDNSAKEMAGPVYLANVDQHCTNQYSYGSCKIHVIGAVSQ